VASFAGGDTETRTESESHDAYLEREIDRTIAAVATEYDRFRFHRVVGELQRFTRLLRRYREYEPPYRYAYDRALRALSAMVAPIAPYLGEELWNRLGEDGPLAGADWPTPLHDVEDYRVERQLIRRTLDDVRDITDVVDIEDPEAIEVVVAQAWQYRAYELARDADPDAAIVGELMDDETVAEHGEAAADFAASLAQGDADLTPALAPEREAEVLRQAAWLFEDEFGASVTVRTATPDDDLATKARPNKPAIHIS
jgi:leucyl-tRNA synthetase